jgi:hypothetical protein
MLFKQNEKLRRFNIMAYDQMSEPLVSDLLSALTSSCVPREIGLKPLSQEASVSLFRGLASASTIHSLSTTQFEYRPQDLEILSQSLCHNATIRKLSLAAVSGRDPYNTDNFSSCVIRTQCPRILSTLWT